MRCRGEERQLIGWNKKPVDLKTRTGRHSGADKNDVNLYTYKQLKRTGGSARGLTLTRKKDVSRLIDILKYINEKVYAILII